MNKKLWIPITLLVAVGAGTYGWWSHRKTETRWRTAVVERGPIQISVTSTGALQAVTTVQVGTQVSGTIAALYADFNSHVKKGQVIARLDETLLRAALSDAQSTLLKAKSQEFQTSEELKRNEALFQRALISQSELDVARANQQVAAANFASAKAGLDRARINLNYATIISPIDGIVLSRAVDVGQTVAASFNTPTLFSIAGDLREMQVLASVDEADIGKIKLGQKANFTVDAYPDTTFLGTVQQIRLEPITTQNVVTYNVVFRVPNPDLKLMPGMTANLTIAILRKENVLLVPAAALRFQPPLSKPKNKSKSDSSTHQRGSGEWKKKNAEGAGEDSQRGKVFLLQGGKPTFMKVTLGITDGTKAEVEGEINPGDSVIIGIDSTKATPSTAKPFGMQQGGGGRGFR